MSVRACTCDTHEAAMLSSTLTCTSHLDECNSSRLLTLSAVLAERGVGAGVLFFAAAACLRSFSMRWASASWRSCSRFFSFFTASAFCAAACSSTSFFLCAASTSSFFCECRLASRSTSSLASCSLLISLFLSSAFFFSSSSTACSLCRSALSSASACSCHFCRSASACAAASAGEGSLRPAAAPGACAWSVMRGLSSSS
mmetsp:Transcript_42239/g.62108  ORF Transcript_42239/g.62108 Transcript_42239/m.62108 type:complete len:200 (-) Transcript_42239:343-942(-)